MAKVNPNGKPSKWIPAKNAERERSRVRSLRNAFQTLQSCLPSVPPDTKLSKLDILILATNYISILMQTLSETGENTSEEMDVQQSYLFISNSDGSNNTEKPIQHHMNCPAKVYRPIKKWPMRSRLYSMVRYEELHCSNQMMKTPNDTKD